MIDAEDNDIFLLKELKDAVRSVIVHCTITEPALGGKTKVGPRKVVEVLIVRHFSESLFPYYCQFWGCET